MYYFFVCVLVSFLSACAPLSPQHAAPAKPPPLPPLTAAAIVFPGVVVEESPFSVRLAEPVFATSSVLPRVESLKPLSTWLDYIRTQPERRWQVEVTATAAESDRPEALAAARADLLRRMARQRGLSPEYLKFTAVAAATSAVIFRPEQP